MAEIPGGAGEDNGDSDSFIPGSENPPSDQPDSTPTVADFAESRIPLENPSNQSASNVFDVGDLEPESDRSWDAPASDLEASSDLPVSPINEPIEQEVVIKRVFPEISDSIAKLMDAFTELKTDIERKSLDDSARDNTIERLHTELQQYKSGLLEKLVTPLVMEMITLHDNLGKTIQYERERSEQAESGSDNPVAEAHRSTQLQIEDILERQGITPFKEESQYFDGKRQRAITVTPAESESDSQVVYERVRVGFDWDGKVVRPELVNVYGRYSGDTKGVNDE